MRIKMSFSRVFLILCCGVGVFLLTGCNPGSGGVFRDRSFDYLKATACPYIGIPEGLHPEPFSKEYQIP